MTLGDILASARRSSAALDGWLVEVDPELGEAVRRAAADGGMTPAQLSRIAVADFSRYADVDTWSQLTRGVRDAEDPGALCLVFMLRWRLAQSCTKDCLN